MNRDILISGCGIAGPAVAFWLLRGGYKPTLVERAPALRTGGYLIDFWGVGYDVAERMGLLPVLHEDGYRMEELKLVGRDGRRVGGFDVQVFQKATNGRFLSLRRGDLAQRVYDLVGDRVETIFGDSVTSLEQHADGVDVGFEHSSARRFGLVVGADGLHSNVRTLAFGAQPDAEKYLGYYTAAYSADHYPHRDEGAYVSYAVPGRQAARYAIRDDRSTFFFIFAEDRPLSIEQHDQAAQHAALRARFAGEGWECDEMLERLDDAGDFYFDTVSQMRLPSWSRGRVVLLGDAAYCPSLLAGQGSAFALAGAMLLARALGGADGAHEQAFADYERRFKPFIEGKQRTAEQAGGWFAPKTRFGLWLRTKTTYLMAGFPAFGNYLAARTFGDTFELPPAPPSS
jgi:2-polyprenyl-6-methoxyphenol hydroxylase-like FAD-dependent oxidoreductase